MATDPLIAALAGPKIPLFAVPQEKLQQMSDPYAAGVRVQQRALEADPFMQWDPSKTWFNERFTGKPETVPQPAYDYPYGAAARGMPESFLHPYRGKITPGEMIVPPGVGVSDPTWGVSVGRDVRAD